MAPGPRIEVPDPSLVLLIGPSGSGKTTFARRHFRPTEILTSDVFRAMVADDESAPDAGGDAFLALRYVAAKRVRRRRLTVIDATNVRASSRKMFVDMAGRHDLPAIAVVFDLPAPIRVQRNARHRSLPAEDFDRQVADLGASLPQLAHEGFAAIHLLDSEEAVGAASVTRRPAPAAVPPSDQTSLPL